MTTGKTKDLTRRNFVGKVMSLLFNMLSRLNITFLPRSKSLLISWLQSPSAVILEPPKINSANVYGNLDHGIRSPHFMANGWGNSGNNGRLYFGGGSKITADGDYSHEIKRSLLLEGKL